MSTSKNTSDGVTSNGANDLIAELKSICGVYAADIKMIKDGTDGVDGKNLILLGKKNSDATFQKVMTLFSNVAKIKELGKDATKDVKPTTEETIEDAIVDTTNKIKSIQDFAFSKQKNG